MHETPDATPDATQQDLRCEPNQFSVTFAIYSGLGLAAVMVFGMVLMYAMFQSLARNQLAPTPQAASWVNVQPPPVEPELQPDLRQFLVEMRQAETEVLSSYAWIDQQQGIAQIPIERAMQILVSKEPPANGSSSPDTGGPGPADAGADAEAESSADGEGS